MLMSVRHLARVTGEAFRSPKEMRALVIDADDQKYFQKIPPNGLLKDYYQVSSYKIEENKDDPSKKKLKAYEVYNKFEKIRNGLTCLILYYSLPIILQEITFGYYFSQREEIRSLIDAGMV